MDERENQQGIAHLVEHVTFLGSQRREGLLGTGARSNAYTDFHHTVFHVHAPLRNANTQEPMLPQVSAPGMPGPLSMRYVLLLLTLHLLLTHPRDNGGLWHVYVRGPKCSQHGTSSSLMRVGFCL